MCGGMPFMMASVMKILRKSWGAKRSGCRSASVSPVAASASLRSVRMALVGIAAGSRGRRCVGTAAASADSRPFVDVVGGDQRDAAVLGRGPGR